MRGDVWRLTTAPREGVITHVAADSAAGCPDTAPGGSLSWLLTASLRGRCNVWDMRYRIPVSGWQHPAQSAPSTLNIRLYPFVCCLLQLLMASSRQAYGVNTTCETRDIATLCPAGSTLHRVRPEPYIPSIRVRSAVSHQSAPDLASNILSCSAMNCLPCMSSLPLS